MLLCRIVLIGNLEDSVPLITMGDPKLMAFSRSRA